MLEIVTLEEIKQNSRIDGDEEDVLLTTLGMTAAAMVENMTRRSWYEIEADYGGEYPLPLKRAVLMLTDHLYQHRGATAAQALQSVPWGISFLVKPYIRLGKNNNHQHNSKKQ